MLALVNCWKTSRRHKDLVTDVATLTGLMDWCHVSKQTLAVPEIPLPIHALHLTFAMLCEVPYSKGYTFCLLDALIMTNVTQRFVFMTSTSLHSKNWQIWSSKQLLQHAPAVSKHSWAEWQHHYLNSIKEHIIVAFWTLTVALVKLLVTAKDVAAGRKR